MGKKKIKGFKAFDKDMKCRGFQYVEGKTYKTGNAEICQSGFHFCINPLDTLNYYELIAIQPYWVDSTRIDTGRTGRWESRFSQFCKLDYQLFYSIVILLMGVIIIINWDEQY